MSGESSSRDVWQRTVLSCRHRNVVLVGSDETGLRSARCADCRSPLTRRIERGEYIYFVLDNGDDADAEYANRKARP